MVRALAAWCRLFTALTKFVLGGPSLRELETVQTKRSWLGLLTIVRMLVFRRRAGSAWPYRPRVARLIRTLNRWLPEEVVYRGMILPLCVKKLAGMARRNVALFGANLQAQTGLSTACQFADVLSLCVAHPGVFPTEYYVYGMHQPEMRRRAWEITDAYEIEAVVSVVHPVHDVHHGSGFTSQDLDYLHNKETFRALCLMAGVPSVRSVAISSGGEIRWTGEPALPAHDLFLKPLAGGEGRGAARVFYDAAHDTFRLDTPVALLTTFPYPTEPMTRTSFIAWLQKAGEGLPFLLEPRLAAHSRLVELVGGATLPTIRIVTASDREGVCTTLYGYLRFAVADVSVDNGAAGGLGAMIDLRTGRLGVAGSLFGANVDVHPLTGRTLAGFAVPHIDWACEHSLQLHRVLAAAQEIPVPVVGWDVAILEDGPVFTEGNALCAISTPQKLSGQGSWALEAFRRSILSYLQPLAGQRIPVDPGLDRRTSTAARAVPV